MIRHDKNYSDFNVGQRNTLGCAGMLSILVFIILVFVALAVIDDLMDDSSSSMGQTGSTRDSALGVGDTDSPLKPPVAYHTAPSGPFDSHLAREGIGSMDSVDGRLQDSSIADQSEVDKGESSTIPIAPTPPPLVSIAQPDFSEKYELGYSGVTGEAATEKGQTSELLASAYAHLGETYPDRQLIGLTHRDYLLSSSDDTYLVYPKSLGAIDGITTGEMVLVSHVESIRFPVCHQDSIASVAKETIHIVILAYEAKDNAESLIPDRSEASEGEGADNGYPINNSNGHNNQSAQQGHQNGGNPATVVPIEGQNSTSEQSGLPGQDTVSNIAQSEILDWIKKSVSKLGSGDCSNFVNSLDRGEPTALLILDKAALIETAISEIPTAKPPRPQVPTYLLTMDPVEFVAKTIERDSITSELFVQQPLQERHGHTLKYITVAFPMWVRLSPVGGEGGYFDFNDQDLAHAKPAYEDLIEYSIINSPTIVQLINGVPGDTEICMIEHNDRIVYVIGEGDIRVESLIKERVMWEMSAPKERVMWEMSASSLGHPKHLNVLMLHDYSLDPNGRPEINNAYCKAGHEISDSEVQVNLLLLPEHQFRALLAYPERAVRSTNSRWPKTHD